MKSNIVKPIVLLATVISIVAILGYQKSYRWEKVEKKYGLAFVKGFVGGGAGPSQNKYSYKINNIDYYGKNYDLKQNEFYVIAISMDDDSKKSIEINAPINPNLLTPQPSSGWTECPINKDGTIKEKYKRSNDPWYLKKARYVVGEAMDTSMRYIYRFKWRYASVSNVEIGKHYMLKINADNLKQYELASTVPIDTAKLQIQTNGGWEECPVTKEGVIKDKFKK